MRWAFVFYGCLTTLTICFLTRSRPFQYKNRPGSRPVSVRNLSLFEFGEVLDGADHLRSVGVLVVIPSDDLDFVFAFVDFGDHGLGGIEEGAIAHADDVGGDDLVFVVAEGLRGLGLHRGVDLLDGDVFAFNDGEEERGGAGRDGDALGGADEFAVELGDDEADGLGSAGAVRDDVGGAGTGTAEVAFAVRAIKDHLVAGVGVDGAHDAGNDREVVIEGFGHRGEAVGGAAGRGDDLVFRGEGFVVDVEDDGLEVFARRSGDDDFAGASVDVGHRFVFGGVEAGAFENDVDAELAPRQILSLRFGIDGDFFAIDDDRAGGDDGFAIFGIDRGFDVDGVELLADRAAVAFLRGVIFQKVGEHLGLGEVVDRDDFIPFGAEHLTESEAADAPEPVDCYFN